MDHTRHLDIYNFPPGFTITIIGAGGIGALTALTLTKMGVPVLNIFDDDFVDETNLPGQLHKLSDVGVAKPYALQDTLSLFGNDTQVDIQLTRIEETTRIPFSNVLISAVDSINSRKAIWAAMWGNPNIEYYVDSRMGAEEYQHYAFGRNDMDAAMRYDNELGSINEEDIPDLPCTAKATFYTADFAAGHVCTVVRNIICGEFEPHRLVHYIPQEKILKFSI